MKTILEYLINKNTKERKYEFQEFLEYFVSLGGNYKINNGNIDFFLKGKSKLYRGKIFPKINIQYTGISRNLDIRLYSFGCDVEVDTLKKPMGSIKIAKLMHPMQTLDTDYQHSIKLTKEFTEELIEILENACIEMKKSGI